MYAVVKTGGKQYRVSKDDILRIERLEGDAGDAVTLGEVLMVGDGAEVTIGAPLIAGASVAAEIVEQTRGDKIIIFKKRRRQNYRRRKGHRQHLTVVRITDILTDGKKASAKKPAAKKAAPKKDATKAAEPKAAEPAADFIDDVSLIGGVGPVLKKKLEGYGVTSLTEIAKMSDAAVAKMDEALELHGRATRDEWVEQAKELIAGMPPRTKTDRARADHVDEE